MPQGLWRTIRRALPLSGLILLGWVMHERSTTVRFLVLRPSAGSGPIVSLDGGEFELPYVSSTTSGSTRPLRQFLQMHRKLRPEMIPIVRASGDDTAGHVEPILVECVSYVGYPVLDLAVGEGRPVRATFSIFRLRSGIGHDPHFLGTIRLDVVAGRTIAIVWNEALDQRHVPQGNEINDFRTELAVFHREIEQQGGLIDRGFITINPAKNVCWRDVIGTWRELLAAGFVNVAISTTHE